MAVVLRNNASSQLASSLTTGSTSLSVTAGDGAKYPVLGAGDWFPLTLVKATGALEIVRCTARSGDVMTITRAQEGTTAQAFAAGDRVDLRLTVAVLTDIIAQITALSTAALLDANNLSDLASVPTARTNLGLGTAATANVTTSNVDTTAGRLLKVGDFGPGAAGGPPDTANVDTTFVCGFYKFGAAAPGNPVPSTGGSLIVSSLGGNFIQQITITLDGGSLPIIHARHYNAAGSPGTWVRLWHNGNLTQAAIIALIGYTPVQQGTGGGQTTSTVKIGWDGTASLRATVDSTDLGKLWTEAAFKRPDAGWLLIGNGTVLPAGGTWAYFHVNHNGSGLLTGGFVSTAPGGTTLSGNLIGFAWRYL